MTLIVLKNILFPFSYVIDIIKDGMQLAFLLKVVGTDHLFDLSFSSVVSCTLGYQLKQILIMSSF